MIQLWVNLPKKHKLTSPHYQALTSQQMGIIDLPGNSGRINVIAGDYNGVAGPASTYSPVVVADLKMKKSATTATSLPAAYNTAILVVNGSASINGQHAAAHSFRPVRGRRRRHPITAEEDALLLLYGQPIDELIAPPHDPEEIVESINFNTVNPDGWHEYPAPPFAIFVSIPRVSIPHEMVPTPPLPRRHPLRPHIRTHWQHRRLSRLTERPVRHNLQHMQIIEIPNREDWVGALANHIQSLSIGRKT